MKKICFSVLLIITVLFSSCGKNETEVVAVAESIEAESLKICSFNIQFLGLSTSRDDAALANILKDYDIVVIQELVAPSYSGTFPDDTSFRPDTEAAEFFNEMNTLGFNYLLSTEDTGTGDNNHINSSATEWWVSFFKTEKVKVASDVPSGFLADDRTNHDDYERVPYAFAFQTQDEDLDFVLISVHLKPGRSSADRARRKHEITAIASWIDNNDEIEKDFIILGDMNIENREELSDATPSGYLSLNDECAATNTNVRGPKPYDHVMYNTTYTKEIDEDFDFAVINLIEAMKTPWEESSTEPYPGDPYDHNTFRKYYSDHHPVAFRLVIPENDDD